MIDLKDDRIFEYLMTSDFIENYKPDEWKFLLLKFRSFYKILRGTKEREIGDREFELKSIKSSLESTKRELDKQRVISTDLQNKIDLSKKKRKLTWRERWKGEIENYKSSD